MSVIVVTGANGFVGAHVVALASEAGHDVWAIGREPSAPPTVNAHATRYSSADLSEGWPISEDVDAIIHLAGLAAVGPSFSDPQRYIEINSRIMTHLGERLLASGAPTRVVVVSSGAVYTPTESGTVTESSATAPSSPYVVAKLLVEQQAHYYATRGVDVIVARPFNHIGPGQSRGFIVPDLTAAVREAAPGETVPTGNLRAQRDYADVRDVARAHLVLATAPSHRHSVYNISTGVPHSGEEILGAITDALGRDDISTVVDPARIRPNDPPRIAGDSTRLQSEFGWRPTISWDQSVREYIDALPREHQEHRVVDPSAGK
ncbi:NAD-dependent epimerase/dehydratase family protein [Microbacterium sp. SLBN-111]|uniref:NAD-dependent epimerase/dehydratase family protein n=1 Tax=Microbacterium sp. SLBN-111 TaxID=3377733 RepID=UPI003C72195D